jgi:hypothetical protein
MTIKLQNESSFNVKDPNMGIAAMAEADLEGSNIAI